MKNIIIYMLIFSALIVSLAVGDKQKGDIRVEMYGFEHNKGSVRLTLFDDADAFPTEADKAIMKESSGIKNRKAVVVFKDVPYGIYAISVHHDENGNDEFDTNFLGIPSEGYGTSNDAKGSFGPPKFKDAKFTLESKEIRLKIKMSY